MKNLSAKFLLSMGLTSIVMSLLLSATLFNIIPDRKQAILDGRLVLAESVASSSTLFLGRKDYNGISANLEFILARSQDLVAVQVKREAQDPPLILGDASVIPAELPAQSTPSTLVLPIVEGEQEWGKISLFFTDIDGVGWWQKLKNSNMLLIAFSCLTGFLLFYLYLGKMLKALNPSQAVPGRVRSALDTLAEALIVIDAKSNVVLANKAFQTITGESAESILGRTADEFDWQLGEQHPDECERSNDSEFPWITVLESSETIRGAGVWLQAENGNWHKFQVNCSPILSGKKATGVLISLDDVTDLEEKEKELRTARDAAEEANRAKSDFLSNMSHEIRTPMTAILGFTEVLKRGNGSSDQDWQKHLGTISRSGNHLLELINDVLDLSKVESGALEVESINCKPHAVAHDVIQVLRVRAEAKNIGLKLEIPDTLPETIQTDAGRLRQIITNLVGNAIKFTETGSVEVVLRSFEEKGVKKYAVDVTDSGIGMNDKQQAAVFQPFVQADSSITRRFGGTGLGLSISRKLARALGGDIVLQSEAGVGTTFTAVIDQVTGLDTKFLTPDVLFGQLEHVESQAQVTWQFPDCNVLVIDDAAENRELLTLVLNDLGINTETAENGAIGVEKAKQQHFEVILSDIQMPVMDGYEAVAAMRSHGLEQPIIALTANAMKGYEEKILSSGFSHYMTKPIDIDALSNLLAELLGGTAMENAPPDTSTTTSNSVIDSQALNAGAAENDEPSTSNPPSPAIIERATAPAAVKTFTPIDQNITPIYSRLASSEKLAPVVEKFVTRVKDQYQLMTTVHADKNYEELAGLAHWLKGSGGTIGFDQLSEPAKQLEIHAKNSADNECEQSLNEIKSIIDRLRAGVAPEQPEVNTTPSISTQGSGTSAVHIVESSLLAKNPSFRPIVMKFLPRLRSQIVCMDEAVAEKDFKELAGLAHWLKGSGGTVGFEIFTQPAADMEAAAKSQDINAVSKALLDIKEYTDKIVIPGNDDDAIDSQKSA